MRLQGHERGAFTWREGKFVMSTERHPTDSEALVELYRAVVYWVGGLGPGRFRCALADSLPFKACPVGAMCRALPGL